MARNLCRTDCAACGCDEIVLEEEARPIRDDEAGVYYGGYEGMLVAIAHCSMCKALYLAWVDERPRVALAEHWRRGPGDRGFADLSWRHAFNDEPSIRDLPLYEVTSGSRRLVQDLHHEACVIRHWPWVYADFAFTLRASSWERDSLAAWTERLMDEVSA